MLRTYRARSVAAAAAVASVVVCGVASHAQPTPPAAASGPPPLPAMVQWYTTPGGVKYAEVTVGRGAPPQDGQTVIVHFTGWLDDGKQFDTTRGAKPFGFALGSGQVIRGWDEGIRGMKVGGKRRLIIPPELGYRSVGVPGKVPPDATLTFDIELLYISDKK